MRKIKFGTSGWRAIISDEFTFENVKIVTQAIADYLKKNNAKAVIVARDTRFMTEHYAQLVSQVLTANGIKVYMPQDPTPTPVVSFTIRHYKLDGGINITASHNPPEYCGIKFNPSDGAPAPTSITQQIEELAAKVDPKKIPTISLKEAASKDLFEIFDPRPEYFKALAKHIDFERIKAAGLKAVADLLYGTAVGYLDELCRRCCAELEILHDFRDPYFGGDRPEPDESRMKAVGEIVKRRAFDCGIATDGDADRFGVVDETGNYLKPNEVIALLAHHLYKNKRKKGPVARTVATSHAVDAVAQAFGEKSLETPVGFKYLAALLLNENVVIAGEESGGLSIANHVPEKDGILANLLVLEMMAYEGKPLSELRKEFAKTYGEFFNTRVDLSFATEGEKQDFLSKFKQFDRYLKDLKVADKDEIDGVRFFFDQPGSWVLARASGTEPVVRVYVEAKDQKTFQTLMNVVRMLIRT
ncbi:phosphoglucomutase/phosphomannomutase family protein [Pseudothermotoga thermarum]|uniref:Phosphoglucomutase/phosphomannomutase alpha/beta/alpha domain I n=1 Tax=Pseudothermotoga thermarum DSM 5069 TaxID=688269 RepID=F7YWU1_9THEM|nr:phosphoglucomutase/phosphomannomutase family protein [Pseudothermotoga thermarum]AEH50342.1 phosphoglucomutase/phosphomannomutase alpha/beta/alpha domain I [Pseudothermotoga thermarum DSM 5069]